MDAEHEEQTGRLTADQLPAEIWAGHAHTSIHATILFADLQNSVMISSTLSPIDYDKLLSAVQDCMYDAVSRLQEMGLPVAEFAVSGDQLVMFFYDPSEVADNYRLDGPEQIAGEDRTSLIRARRESNHNLAFDAFKAAVILKNSWLTMSLNSERITNHQEPYGLGIGIHYGRVFLRERRRGIRRIEGFSVNLAKRIESASRQGKFSQIMFSQDAKDSICQLIKSHTQLSQRIFFHTHEIKVELLKGITNPQTIFELKFFQRIAAGNDEEIIRHYETIFALNKANRWAYFQLFDWYGFKQDDWQQAYELANKAFVVYPRDEKILYDLGRCNFEMGDLKQAKRYCEMALVHNDQFDIVYELLIRIAIEMEDPEAEVRYAAEALRLSPNSPINQVNYALSLSKSGDYQLSANQLKKAIAGYAKFGEYEQVLELIEKLKANKAWDGENQTDVT